MMSSVDGKILVTSAYHAIVIIGLAIGYAQLGKKLLKNATPTLDFNAYDMSMVALDVGLTMAIKDMLAKQGIILAGILK